MFNGKTILITGGTGSLGKQLTKILLTEYKPKKLIIFSRDELKQFDMRKKWNEHTYPAIRYFLGDVRDRERLMRAFHGVDYVIHAAALKQVPAAEYNPSECINTNIMGAMNVIDAALYNGVQRVVALSTDKACNPVNLYGATKLCSDKLFIAGNAYSSTGEKVFSVVRYGNVVGSRGSVIPFFKEKAKTGTLPITDPRMTRFWITLDQAAHFVLRVLEESHGGEIFVPKIPSMKIIDLGTAMAPEAKQEVVGIRSGEKIHEVLIGPDDSRTTFELDDHYVLLPQDLFDKRQDLYPGARRCDDQFEYNSGTNPWMMTVPELREMVAVIGEDYSNGYPLRIPAATQTIPEDKDPAASFQKFGKPFGPILKHKTSYYEENDQLLENSRRIGRVYCSQPIRSACKNCATSKILDTERFSKQEISYWFCDCCGHMNGEFEDSEQFCAEVYTGSGSENYAKTYSAEDQKAFDARLQDIYMPKAEFLLEALQKEGVDAENTSFTDFGAGSGYFAGALNRLGARSVTGYEVSPHQVAFGNALLGKPLLVSHALGDTVRIARETQSAVVSMIGVLEHLRQPREMLQACAENSAVRYIFFSVPLFSPTVFLEMVFPEVVQRHLAGRHTHLYTEQSIDWFCQEFGFIRRAEWWFGADMSDLYRDVFVMLKKQHQDPRFIERWKSCFLPVVDDLQLVLDKKKNASEVHMLLKKRG